MAIDKKLIHFKNWNKFISDGVGSEEHVTTPTSGKEEEGTAIYGQIKGTSIVFIKDVSKIWTHGKVYCADQDLSEYVTDSELENLLVFGKGEAENSAVLKGEYQGYSNTAISQTSIAIGAATTAGLKGWYYSKIDFNTKQITISDRQPTVLLNNLIGGNWNSGTLNINIGDVISIINDSKYDKCSKVSNVNGNIITVESLPFTELNLSIISANNPDDWSIYITERPDAGIIDFGGGSLSEGANTKATNIASHAEGIQTHAYGQYSHAEGFGTKAGYSAHAEGKNTTASGEQSHAEGFSTHATGNNSHAEGKETYATQYSAHAEGYGTVAGDSTSPVIENTSPAEGCYTHAEGNGTRAVGHSSHAEGRGSVAQGKMSHAEGLGTKAIGNASHAEGNKTVANGSSSHAEGIGTVTNNVGEHACGSYNESNTDTIFSVGIGSSDTKRKNALEVDKNGNVYTYINNTKTSIQDELGHILFNVTSFSDYKHLSDEDVSKLEKLNEVHLKRTYSDQYVTRILKRNNYTYVDDLGSYIHFSCIDDDYSYNLTLDVLGKSISWNQNSLLTTNDLKTINGNSIVGSGNVEISGYDDTELKEEIAAIQPMISVTWSELKEMRDNATLKPGQQYRITDYVTTTSQAETQSAGHQFDVIVIADSENTLNDVARACIHDGDTYFSDAGAKLEAWQIWYSLDNDAERFAWADAENGKGVIYRMIDEWNNECPYDFKNIMFKRFAVTEYDKVPSLVVDNEENYYGYYYGSTSLWGEQAIQGATYGEDFVWVYTFALKNLATETWHDYTTLNSIGLKTDESVIITCHSNIIKEHRDEYIGEYGSKTIVLNNIVFFNCYADISSPDYSDDYSHCNSNSFGTNCFSNTFGSYCILNSFGNSCWNNTFGTGCTSNSFENICYNNTFGNNCWNNSFGNDCILNSFGNSCGNNTFGTGCSNNSFGNDCNYNSFCARCDHNTFGNECSNNSFGNDCNYNSFGNICFNNSLANSCSYNSFRLSPSNIEPLKDYCYYNHFDDGCSYNVIWNSGTTSSDVWLKNINVNRGVSSTYNSYNMINIEVLNQDYEIQVAKNSNGEIKIYCEADLIA